MKVTWRKNVLVLVGAGYFVTLVIFVALVTTKTVTVDEAYNIIAGPLMALIGGSLAIAKDLIAADHELGAENADQNGGANDQGGHENENPANEQNGE